MLAAQIIYALMLAGGGIMELVGTLGASLLPAELQRVLGRIHQDPWVMRWVVFSNALHLLIAVGLLRGALGIRRGHVRGLVLTRWCAWVMVGLIAVGQCILAMRMYPTLAGAELPAGSTER